MRKRRKGIIPIVSTLLILAISVGIYIYLDNSNYYEPGHNGRYKVRVGQSFRIELPENMTAEYQNCWINEGKCPSVKLLYIKSNTKRQQQRYIGAAKRITLTFEGVQTGTDTIKFRRCLTGRMSKTCNDFQDDAVKADNKFVVTVY